MKKKDYEALLDKFYAGETSVAEEQLLQKELENNEGQEFEAALFKLGNAVQPDFSQSMVHLKVLESEAETKAGTKLVAWYWKPLAVASVLLLLGFAALTLSNRSGSWNEEGLRSPSANTRLMTIAESYQVNQPDQAFLEAFFAIVEEDDNVNVRLAALERIAAMSLKEEEQMRLMEAMLNEESPMVQMALADLIVLLVNAESGELNWQRLLDQDGIFEEPKQKMIDALSN